MSEAHREQDQGLLIGHKPHVGMGATICYWTDRQACTVISVSESGHTVVVQADQAIRTDKNGMSECQSYRYEPDRNGVIRWFTLRKNGRYVQKGSPMKEGTQLVLGIRNQYHDYSF